MANEATVKAGALGDPWRRVDEAATRRGYVARVFRNNSGCYRRYGNCTLAIIDPKKGTTYSTRSRGLVWDRPLGGGCNLEVRNLDTILGRSLYVALRWLTGAHRTYTVYHTF